MVGRKFCGGSASLSFCLLIYFLPVILDGRDLLDRLLILSGPSLHCSVHHSRSLNSIKFPVSSDHSWISSDVRTVSSADSHSSMVSSSVSGGNSSPRLKSPYGISYPSSSIVGKSGKLGLPSEEVATMGLSRSSETNCSNVVSVGFPDGISSDAFAWATPRNYRMPHTTPIPPRADPS